MKMKLFLRLLQVFSLALIFGQAHALVRTSAGSGNWNNPATWIPAGTPGSNDIVIVAAGHVITVNNSYTTAGVTVEAGAALSIMANKVFTVAGTLEVNGTMTMNGGDITFTIPNSSFIIGSAGSFTWQPKTNTLAGASLFTNGSELFSPGSTLIIKKWYDYSIPLASVISGNFGNLTLNSVQGITIQEWNQNNEFAQHHITGTLTIDQGWIVLDKSGTCTSTSSGNISLLGANSFLDLHGGTHPGTFSVTTTNIINNGGSLNGIYDGNGNVILNVTGDLTNSGIIRLIQNDGVASTGNGNAMLNVTGAYTQTAGDFRAIFNITTTNAGTVSLNMGSLSYTGGIFMAHYGCVTNGGISSLHVSGGVTIDYPNAACIFRGQGLTKLGSVTNNGGFNWVVDGDMTISGNPNANFTSSAASGAETFLINGNISINGGYGGWNYGSSAGAHASRITINGNMDISAGTFFISGTGGSATASLTGNLTQTGGTLTLASDTGSTVLGITGDVSQTGGTFFMTGAGNSTATTNSTIQVGGNFIQTGGIFNMSRYSGSTINNGTGMLNVSGDVYISAIATFTETSAAAGKGVINFVKAGIQQFDSDIPLTGTIDYVLLSGATVDLGKSQFTGSGSFSALSGSGIIISEASGLSATGVSGGIQVTGSRNFDPAVTYTYSGSVAQVTGDGLPAAVERIVVNNSHHLTLTNSVNVTGELVFTKGKIITGTKELTVTSSIPTAITGYSPTSYVVGNLRRNVSPNSTYDFPVGTLAHDELVAVSFSNATGLNSLLAKFTEASPVSLPLTNLTVNNAAISNVLNYGYWTLLPDQAMTGGKYKVTLREKGHTNKGPAVNSYCVLKRKGVQFKWESAGTHNNNTQSESNGMVVAARSDLSSFSDFVIAYTGGVIPLQSTGFDANDKGDAVDVSWNSAARQSNTYFIVERSSDGKEFEEIDHLYGEDDLPASKRYLSKDYQPLPGKSYYRLKRTEPDGSITYSDVVTVNRAAVEESQLKPIEITAFGPNPFNNWFNISYTVSTACTVELQLINSNGQVVLIQKLQATAGKNQFDFAGGSKFAAGSYVLALSVNGARVTKTVIRENK